MTPLTDRCRADAATPLPFNEDKRVAATVPQLERFARAVLVRGHRDRLDLRDRVHEMTPSAVRVANHDLDASIVRVVRHAYERAAPNDAP